MKTPSLSLKLHDQSLRIQLIAQGLLLVSLMTVVCLVVFFLGRQDNAITQYALNHKVLMGNYFSTAQELKDTMLEYINTAQESPRQTGITLADQMVKQADELQKYYKHPDLADQYHLSVSCHDAAMALFLLDEAPSSEASFTLYKRADHIVQLLLHNESRQLNTEKRLISSAMDALTHMQNVRFWAIMLVLFSLSGICMVLSFRIAHRITVPMEQLTRQVRKFSCDMLHYTPVTDARSGDEISLLSGAFDQMVQTIQAQVAQLNEQIELSQRLSALELENMRMNMMLAQSELRATQSLINPHFLYNCLNSISSLAYMEGAEKSRDAIQLIATFLRDSLSQMGRVITLEDELNNIWRYIDIQRLRFGERIAYEVNCDAACLSARIPAMSIQPLIENAIVHGLGSTVKQGEISLDITLGSGHVKIEVLDNGKGIPAEKIDELNAMLRDDAYANLTSFGLKSVYMQLKSYFEDDIHISIQSVGEMYTLILLCFPCQRD